MRKVYRYLFCSLASMVIPLGVSAATVTPNSMEIIGQRGETVQATFSIINTEASAQEYYLGVMGFDAKDDTGAPQFFSTSRETAGLTQWISFASPSVVVPALSKGEMPFTITIPDDVSSGGYYAALTVSPAPADVVAQNGAIIEAKTAILVLLTVEGETIESLALVDFTSSGERTDVPSATFRYRLQNQGNVHVKPEGTITLTGLFGQTIARIDANETQGRVLPNTTRTFEVAFAPNVDGWFQTVAFQLRQLTIGSIDAELDLSYGEEGSIHSELELWVIPWQLFVTMLVLVVLLCLPLCRRRARSH